MESFLYRIAELFYQEYGNNLYKNCFIFPNRRAGVFFQKYLSDISQTPIFSPKVLTVQDLFASLSHYHIADNISLLIILYKKYQGISGSKESFDDFLAWGEMLLNDFSDVDKYLVDARQLFSNVKDLKQIVTDFSFLTQTQLDAIRNFWTNFIPFEGNTTKKHFLETWEILYELYRAFHKELDKQKIAYEGMLFRDVVEQTKENNLSKLTSNRYIFVGLNALSEAEKQLMLYLKKQDRADFYWDYASPLICDSQNKASFWIEDNLHNFPSRFALSKEISKRPTIEAIGIPSATGQAKQVTQIIKSMIETKEIINSEDSIHTAIVLPDEKLLQPILYSIPEEIEKINVTMGYALSNTSISGLVELISLLHCNKRTDNDKSVFYYKHVQAILSHPLVISTSAKAAETIKQDIFEKNRIVLTDSELQQDEFLSLIFKNLTGQEQIPNYLKTIFAFLHKNLSKEKEEIKEAEGDTRSIDLEREFIVQYYKTIDRLSETIEHVGIQMEIKVFFRLLKNLSSSISVPFLGEPLSGLQIMGVLETRVLDFKNIIILSANEGVFPSKRQTTSFIPYTLRKGFGLPTIEHQDSIYAYHFYRMISRAEHVFMLYDTRTEDMKTGEVSRYFNQLKYLYQEKFDIEEHILSYNVNIEHTPLLKIDKTPEIMKKLERFKAGGLLYLSASSLNSYITSPLEFYFTAIEGLSDEDEITESVESALFGTIFHQVMERLYNQFKKRTITHDILNDLYKDDYTISKLIKEAFAQHLFKRKGEEIELSGHNQLVAEIISSYVKQTLKADMQYTPFEFVKAELLIKREYKVADSLSVNLKAFIDRIDQKDNRYRIVDYKTGDGKVSFKELEELFCRDKQNRPYQIFQVLFYMMLYQKENPTIDIDGALYYIQKIFQNNSPNITMGKTPIYQINDLLSRFEEYLKQVIEEIFDPNIPFTQVPDAKYCQWSEYFAPRT